MKYAPMTSQDWGQVWRKYAEDADKGHAVITNFGWGCVVEQAVLARIESQGLVIVPRELLAEIEAIKSCADAFEFDASVRKAIIEKQQAEKAALIAELRTIKRDGISGFVDHDDVQAILAKYEEKR